MRHTKVHFANHHGHQISARLDQPDEEPYAYALFAHCFTCHKNLNAVRDISRALCAVGFAVLRFDFTGLGESEGEFADTNFSSNVADLERAADYLAQHHEPPKLLIGHSLGGAAVLQAAGRISSSTAVATIGAPCDPGHVKHLLDQALDEIEEDGEAQVTLVGRTFTIKKQFIDDLEQTNMLDKIRNLDRALAIFHSPVDNTVGIDNAARIFTTAKHPKSFISLDDADHLLTDSADAQYVGRVLAAWADRYVVK